MILSINKSSRVPKLSRISTLYFHLLMALILSLLVACSSDSGNTADPNPTPVVLEPLPESNGTIQPVSTNTNTGSLPTAAKIQINDAGDAMAVWIERTGIGIRANYSRKLANDTQWSATKVVYELHNEIYDSWDALPANQFVTDGVEFAISWTDGVNVYARTHANTTGNNWGPAITLNENPNNQRVESENLQVASNRAGILVAWLQNNKFYGREYKNSAWQTNTEIIQDMEGIVADARITVGYSFSLQSSKQNYAILGYVVSSNLTTQERMGNVFSIIRDTVTPSLWGTIRFLNATGITGASRLQKLLATPTGFLFTWLQSSAISALGDNLYSREVAIAPTGEIWTEAKQVNGEIPVSARSYSVSISNNSYGFAWLETVTDVVTNILKRQVSVRLYDVSTLFWQSSLVVSGTETNNDPPQIVGFGDQHVVAWRGSRDIVAKPLSLTDTSSTPVTISRQLLTDNDFTLAGDQSRVFVLWSDLDFYSKLTRLATSSSDLLQWDTSELHAGIDLLDNTDIPFLSGTTQRYTFNNGQLWYSWLGTIMENGLKVTRVFLQDYNAGWQVPYIPLGQNSSTSGQLPKTLTNAVGHTLSVWYQYDNGKHQVFASIRKQGVWSAPVNIVESRYTQNSHINSRYLDQYKMATANDGFIITWGESKNKFVKEYDGKQWLGSVELDTGLSWLDTNVLYNPIPFNENNQYRILWIENDPVNNEFVVYHARKINGLWDTQILLTLADPEPIPGGLAEFSLVKSVANVYLLSFIRDGATLVVPNVYARLFKDNQWLTDRQKISADTGNYSSSHVTISFSNGYFAIAWREDPIDFTSATSGIYASIYDPSAENNWLPPQQVNFSGSSINLAANNTTMALASAVGRDIRVDVYDPVNHTWPTAQSVVYTNTIAPRSISIAGNGDEFMLIWSNRDQNVHLLSLARYQNSSWPSFPVELLNAGQGVEVYDAHVSLYRDEYALTWAQVDLANAPTTSVIKSKLGGF